MDGYMNTCVSNGNLSYSVGRQLSAGRMERQTNRRMEVGQPEFTDGSGRRSVHEWRAVR